LRNEAAAAGNRIAASHLEEEASRTRAEEEAYAKESHCPKPSGRAVPGLFAGRTLGLRRRRKQLADQSDHVGNADARPTGSYAALLTRTNIGGVVFPSSATQ